MTLNSKSKNFTLIKSYSSAALIFDWKQQTFYYTLRRSVVYMKPLVCVFVCMGFVYKKYFVEQGCSVRFSCFVLETFRRRNKFIFAVYRLTFYTPRGVTLAHNEHSFKTKRFLFCKIHKGQTSVISGENSFSMLDK